MVSMSQWIENYYRRFQTKLEIRKLSPSDAMVFINIRLTALRESPNSFIIDISEEEKETPQTILTRIYDENQPSEVFVIGAFEGEQLIGTSAFERETRYKLRHKGTLWGVYVLPDYRKRGIARILVQKTIDTAKEISELNQIDIEVSGEFQRKFYESLSFIRWGVEKNGTKTGENYLNWTHMVLNLRN